MGNNPVNYTDPSGHKACTDTDENGQCVVDPEWLATKGGANQSKEWLADMNPGDIISLAFGTGDDATQYNLMMGVLANGEAGFWNVDAHQYVGYATVQDLLGKATNWEIFTRANDDFFGEYKPTGLGTGTAMKTPELDLWWAGGVDQNPSYAEVHTDIDALGLFRNLVNILSAQILWARGDPVQILDPRDLIYKPSGIALALSWKYIASGQYIEKRYPIIHP